jgi:hypothetical protein
MPATIKTYSSVGFLVALDSPPELKCQLPTSHDRFFAYHLHRIYKFVGKNTVRQPAVLIVSITTAIALGYLVNLMIGVSEISHSQEQKADDIMLMLVSISYPILDGVLLVPAILILWSIRNGKLAFTHWMLIALSMILVAIADSGFGYACFKYKFSTKSRLDMGYPIQCRLFVYSVCANMV